MLGLILIQVPPQANRRVAQLPPHFLDREWGLCCRPQKFFADVVEDLGVLQFFQIGTHVQPGLDLWRRQRCILV